MKLTIALAPSVVVVEQVVSFLHQVTSVRRFWRSNNKTVTRVRFPEGAKGRDFHNFQIIIRVRALWPPSVYRPAEKATRLKAGHAAHDPKYGSRGPRAGARARGAGTIWSCTWAPEVLNPRYALEGSILVHSRKAYLLRGKNNGYWEQGYTRDACRSPAAVFTECAVPGLPSQKERILSKFGQIQGILQNSNF